MYRAASKTRFSKRTERRWPRTAEIHCTVGEGLDRGRWQNQRLGSTERGCAKTEAQSRGLGWRSLVSEVLQHPSHQDPLIDAQIPHGASDAAVMIVALPLAFSFFGFLFFAVGDIIRWRFDHKRNFFGPAWDIHFRLTENIWAVRPRRLRTMVRQPRNPEQRSKVIEDALRARRLGSKACVRCKAGRASDAMEGVYRVRLGMRSPVAARGSGAVLRDPTSCEGTRQACAKIVQHPNAASVEQKFNRLRALAGRPGIDRPPKALQKPEHP